MPTEMGWGDLFSPRSVQYSLQSRNACRSRGAIGFELRGLSNLRPPYFRIARVSDEPYSVAIAHSQICCLVGRKDGSMAAVTCNLIDRTLQYYILYSRVLIV